MGRGPKKITFKNKTNDFKLTLAYPDSATDLLPPGQDKHIATYTVKVPSGKPPAKVVVELNLDRNGCVVLQNAVIMEPIIEKAKPPETGDKGSGEEKKEASGEEKKEGSSEEKKEDSTEEKKDTVDPPAPPKKRFTKVPLKVETETFGLSEKAIKEALELEASMANEDRLITETADKRNELESYIY